MKLQKSSHFFQIHLGGRSNLLADEAVVLVVSVILGVLKCKQKSASGKKCKQKMAVSSYPSKSIIKVHVQVGVSIGIILDEPGECHRLALKNINKHFGFVYVLVFVVYIPVIHWRPLLRSASRPPIQ